MEITINVVGDQQKTKALVTKIMTGQHAELRRKYWKSLVENHSISFDDALVALCHPAMDPEDIRKIQTDALMDQVDVDTFEFPKEAELSRTSSKKYQKVQDFLEKKGWFRRMILMVQITRAYFRTFLLYLNNNIFFIYILVYN